MTQNKEIRWVPLGEFIERNLIRNSHSLYGEGSAVGVNIEKTILPMRGNISEKDFSKFYLIPPQNFAYNPRGSRKLGLGLNLTKETYIITFNDVVFKIKSTHEKDFIPEYLFMYLSRKEWDRFAEYLSWGSSTEVFTWETLCEVQIPVPYKDGEPDVERQREVVAIWQGLRRLKEENEALATPLLELCQAKMDELKHSAPLVELAPFIEPCDERNSDLSVKLSQGISNLKYFQAPKQTATNSRSDKIVRTGQFAYNRATTRNGEKISIAYRDGEDCTVSSAYQIFKLVNEKDFLPHYLMLWFMRPEFDRYARYMSKGSAHEFFEFDEMCRVKIPKPSIEVQRAIVDIYHCARRAKEIAEEASQQLKTICPALMQHIIHS